MAEVGHGHTGHRKLQTAQASSTPRPFKNSFNLSYHLSIFQCHFNNFKFRSHFGVTSVSDLFSGLSADMAPRTSGRLWATVGDISWYFMIKTGLSCDLVHDSCCASIQESPVNCKKTDKINPGNAKIPKSTRKFPPAKANAHMFSFPTVQRLLTQGPVAI